MDFFTQWQIFPQFKQAKGNDRVLEGWVEQDVRDEDLSREVDDPGDKGSVEYWDNPGDWGR